MTIFYFTISLLSLLLVVVSWFWAKQTKEKNQQINDLQNELGAGRIEVARSQEILISNQSLLDESRQKNSHLEDKLLVLERQNIEFATELSSAKKALESERETLNQAKEALSQTFKNLASDVLHGSNKQFLELAKDQFLKERKEAASEYDNRKSAIEDFIRPLQEVLTKYQKEVSQIEKERQRSYTTVESELKRVIESNTTLAQQTSALKNALKKPNVRGRWGEVQLKNCIELAGMSEYADVVFQDQHANDDGRKLIPDMTVKMPGGRLVVVDSKTPLDAFITSLEATNDEEKQIAMLRHGRHVKEHVQKLASKDYARFIEAAADFTVMFLPNESFLYAALEAEPDIVEYALNKRILIATPPTLVGLLKVIRFGWNEEKVAENASKIFETGKELHKRICDFLESYSEVGKSLERAQKSYDVGLKRLESRVIVQAKRFEELGAKSTKELSH